MGHKTANLFSTKATEAGEFIKDQATDAKEMVNQQAHNAGDFLTQAKDSTMESANSTGKFEKFTYSLTQS